MGPAVSIALQAIAGLLFALGIADFVGLVRGCFVLRRMTLAGRLDQSAAILKSPLVPAVSSLAVPPDASPESLGFVRRLLEMHFGRNEVVIVLDGPPEGELATWISEFRLCPSARAIGTALPTEPVRAVYESLDPIRVVVIDKERGGPVDAWNTALNASTSPVIALFDPESDFPPTAILHLIQPMLESLDETVAICGGVPALPEAGLVSRFGALESLGAWMTRGAASSGRNRTLPFPGSAALVRRSAVMEARGFTSGPLELILRLHALGLAAKKPYRIGFLPEAVSRSRAPRTLGELRRQVRRDQHEIAHAFFHRVAIAGPFGSPLLGGLFRVRAARPWLETAAYVLTACGLVAGWVNLETGLLVLLATVGMGMVLSMAAAVLRDVAEPNNPDEQHMATIFFAAIPENLGYRQWRNLWLIAGFRPRA
jgi:hypothetical protein